MEKAVGELNNLPETAQREVTVFDTDKDGLGKRDKFIKDLSVLCNNHGIDTAMNCPDRFIANYLFNVLDSVETMRQNNLWWHCK